MDQVRNFGFLLKNVSRKYSLRFERQTQEMLLKYSNCKALAYLERNEGVSQSKLAELTEIDPMTMVRILDRMEADGLVERRPDLSDRRARCLYLTPNSKPVLDEIWQIAEQIYSEIFAETSQAERDVFLDVLGRINRNLSLHELGSEKAEHGGETIGKSAGSKRGRS
jgi:DNA-binding MarR family transcriptional regulator